jgi:hypothetical protein
MTLKLDVEAFASNRESYIYLTQRMQRHIADSDSKQQLGSLKV